MATTVTIQLRNDLRRYRESQIASGRFTSVDEAIEAALESRAETPGLVVEPTMTAQEAVAFLLHVLNPRQLRC